MLAAAIAARRRCHGGRGAPPQPPPPSHTYTAEKEQLRAMGFGDDAANQRALESTNGNVQRALELLLA